MKNVKITPMITEKGTRMKERNTFLFRVSPQTTKTEFKKYIEKVFGVKVAQVRVAKSYGRSRINMLTRTRYTIPTIKKMYVRLPEGQKLPEELFKVSGE